jgi:hypothetical protein
MDRDLNSAINMWNEASAKRREVMPVDTTAATELVEYFSGIPNIPASLVDEAGSLQSLVGSSQQDGFEKK